MILVRDKYSGGMWSDPFESAEMKVERAIVHAKALKAVIEGFLASSPYRIRREIQGNGTEHAFFLDETEPFPAANAGLIFGDAVHNLRSALDHLIWKLAEDYSGANRGDRQTQFPIFLTRKGFDKRGVGRLQRLSPTSGAIIKAVQPYQNSEPRKDSLWGLQELDATDKHKLIPIVVSAVDEIAQRDFWIPGRSQLRFTTNLGVVHDGMEFLRVSLPDSSLRFEPKLAVTFTVLLRESPISVDARTRPDDALVSFRDRVRNIIELFRIGAYPNGAFDEEALAEFWSNTRVMHA